MTTKRNNMFFSRGEYFMANLILKLADTVNNLDDLKNRLKDISKSKLQYMTECDSKYLSPVIDCCAIITHHYCVSVKDSKYIIINYPKQSKINDIILWSENTNTQCFIEFYGNEDAIKFIDEDENFTDHIAKLVNIADDYEVTNKLKTVCICDLSYN